MDYCLAGRFFTLIPLIMSITDGDNSNSSDAIHQPVLQETVGVLKRVATATPKPDLNRISAQ